MIFLTAFTWLTATDVMIFISQDKHFVLTVLKLLSSQNSEFHSISVKTSSRTVKRLNNSAISSKYTKIYSKL